jgi:tetratricopeptide (TPR) repeat protein
MMDYDRLRELQQKFDENPRRYFAPLANEYRKGGQPKRAIEICRVQLEQMPGHMSGQIVYGQALYEAGEFVEARQVFERALSLDPENLIALRTLGDMSLQAGNTAEARTWYTRLLDADPKDTAVVALISEIDSAAEAKPVAAHVPGIDTDVGDQQIPTGLPESADVVVPDASLLSNGGIAETEPVRSEPEQQHDDYAPLGLERHYPVEEPASAVPAPELQEGPSAEELGVPTGASAAEGLTSAFADVNSALDSVQSRADDSASKPVIDQPSEISDATEQPAVELAQPVENTARVEQPPVAESETTPERSAPPENEAPAARVESQGSVERVGGGERDEPAQRVEPVHTSEEKTFSGASAEPFVNETMAKLYLKQGYKQLALKVYRQLVYARPNDQALKDRIAEIEAADAAEHPGEFPAARQEPPPEERAVEPEAPRAPSIEAPTRVTSPDSDADAFGFDPSPSASPSARQPSVPESFATLGRRRPPRQSTGGGFRPGTMSGNNSSTSSGSMADTTQRAERPASQAADTSVSFAASGPAPSLDSVFAGAPVSPADARAASRLAGAFSGAAGTSRTPPTPPMPTPRVNPRVQAQESEEDVAKFRAWLDGLTGE